MSPPVTMPSPRTNRPQAPTSEVIEIRVERRPTWQRAILRAWETLWAMPARMSVRHLGKGVRLAPPIHVYGGGGIRIADNVAVWPHARLIAHNVANAGDNEPVKLEIGTGTSIFPYAHFSAALSIRIGKRVMIASGSYISDHDHDIRDPDDPARLNNRVIASAVDIGDDVWLGERVCVLRGVTIGEGSIIGAASVVTKSIPARCIAVGAPARVIRQWDESTRTWAPVAAS